MVSRISTKREQKVVPKVEATDKNTSYRRRIPIFRPTCSGHASRARWP